MSGKLKGSTGFISTLLRENVFKYLEKNKILNIYKMVLCDNCKKELPNITCKNCNEMKSSNNFKTNSRVCNECNKMRYDAWKEVNKDKWRKGGDYYKYKKKEKETTQPQSPSLSISLQ